MICRIAPVDGLRLISRSADARLFTSVPTGCWVRLQYAYGSGNQPSDTTSWTAGIEGDPVRLVE
jgi:hypothetical protein